MTENEPDTQGTDTQDGGASPSPEDKVKEILERVRPFLQQDGGDVEFVAYDEGVVSVRLQGACSSCPSSTYTLKMGIENALKQQISEVREVVAVP